jgi:tetratricopeptide (TPR) repeat protein
LGTEGPCIALRRLFGPHQHEPPEIWPVELRNVAERTVEQAENNLYFELNDFRLAQIHYEMAAEVDPTFANAYYNLALVHSITNNFAAAIQVLTKYQQLSSEEDARNANELLHTFKKSLAAKNTRLTGN